MLPDALIYTHKDFILNRQFFKCTLDWLLCLYGNVLLECAEFIAFQIFMLLLLSPPRILISSCQPLTSMSFVSYFSSISVFFLPFFLPLLLYRSLHPIHLTPGPSAPLPFDVSLISPCLSTLVISYIFHCFLHSQHLSIGHGLRYWDLLY